MSKYTPDMWVVIKLADNLYKVFGCWYGGYLHGDSWRLNSGIVAVEEDDDFINFIGESGSIYRGFRGSYGATGYGAGILQHMLDEVPEAKIMPEDTDWEKLFNPQ